MVYVSVSNKDFVGWADFLPTQFTQSSAWANNNILPTLLGLNECL